MKNYIIIIFSFLLYNSINAGTFTNVQEPMGANPGVYISSIAYGDIDNDGDSDIALTGNDGANRRFIIFQNNEATFNSLPSVPTGIT